MEEDEPRGTYRKATIYSNKYMHIHKDNGGKAVVHRFCKDIDKNSDDQPLILAICTPLMARVHTHIQQGFIIVI